MSVLTRHFSKRKTSIDFSATKKKKKKKKNSLIINSTGRGGGRGRGKGRKLLEEREAKNSGIGKQKWELSWREERERERETKSKKGRKKWTGAAFEVLKMREERKGKARKIWREEWGDKGWREEKVEAGADKFYCVSFRPLHLSALFRAERASCSLLPPPFSLSLSHSRRPVSRKKRGTMMYARPC